MNTFLKRLAGMTPLLTVIILSFVAGLPLLHKGLPPTHDGEYHVIRFYEFYRGLEEGVLYPRWAGDLNNTFGVPLFNYVYPLPNYVAAMFHSFGIGFIDSFKLNMFVATLVGAVFFYIWLKDYWRETGALVSSVFYTFSPYHFVDIYVRGSVGEVWALAFFPAFLWAITRLFATQKMSYVLLSGTLLACIIFSHNILALLFFLFVLSYIAYLLLIRKDSRKRLLIYAISVLFIGISLSAIFWLPALTETKYVTGLQIYDIDANFPEIYQLLIPSWGTGFSGGVLQDQMSFQIGLANLFVIFLSLMFLVRYKRKDKAFSVALVFLLWFVLSVFFMLRLSKTFWDVLPFFNYFQFPWRMLSITILSASILAGFTVLQIRSVMVRKITVVLLLCFAVLSTISYTKPAYYHDRMDEHYISRPNFIHGTNSPGNSFNTIWFTQPLEKPKQRLLIVEGTADITAISNKTQSLSAEILAKERTKFVLNTAYFPGWTVFANQKEIPSSVTEDGRIGFTLDRGDYTVQVQLRDTIIRVISKVWTLTTLLIIIVMGVKIKFFDGRTGR